MVMFYSLVSRKDKPSCKLLYVTPERIAGNPSFLEVLKCLHSKVRFLRFLTSSLVPSLLASAVTRFYVPNVINVLD